MHLPTTSMSLPITSIVAACFALLMVAFSLTVSLRRNQKKGGEFGHGGNEVLRRRIRAQGNFTEYVPTALILIALVELAGATKIQVAALGGAFLLSRLLNAAGKLSTKVRWLSSFAIILQHVVFTIAGVWLIFSAFNMLSYT
jgi:uncharacterized protein